MHIQQQAPGVVEQNWPLNFSDVVLLGM